MTLRINWRAPRWGYNMDEVKKNIRRVFWLYFVLFAVLAIYFVKFLFFDSKSIITSPYNPRLKIQDSSVKRGDILDSAGEKLAFTDNNGNRVYPLGYEAAHAVGYYNAGSAGSYGSEAKYNYELQTVGSEVLQRLHSIFYGGSVAGNSIVLTIDAGLQSYIYNQLQDYKAGAIVLEPSTGKILAMVSTPSFDPNSLAGDFNDLAKDSSGSPLLNRAAQGKYAPGSVYKIVTAAAVMEYMPGYEDYTYTCAGTDVVGGKALNCDYSIEHGEEKLTKAFTVSCNTFFANIGLQTGAENLRSMSERFYFNSELPYPLEYSVSSFPLRKESDDSELVDTAIGQGRIMTSPLQIALITSAVANDGILMSPYILDHIQSYDGKITHKTLPVMARVVLTPDISAKLKDMMINVTENGTGSRAAVSNIKIAAKTGSAQASNKGPTEVVHGWYTAFFPADNPRFVLCIVIENIGGSLRVLPMAKNIIEHLTNLGK